MRKERYNYERIGLATEKSDILTGLPLNNSGTIAGNSIMKRIPLSQGKFAIVDDEDYEYLNQWKWSISIGGNGKYYAIRCIGNNKFVRMHRVIMKATKNQEIDHCNGNGLDNRRCNLRFCTHSQNLANMKRHKISSSLYKGVHWDKDNKKWRVQIRKNYKIHNLGRFIDEIKAAKAYNKAAKIYFGEFARLNNV